MMIQTTKHITAALFLLLLAMLPGRAAEPEADASRNIRFGMPGEAKADAESREAYLISRPEYVSSYNDKTKTPNWVSWNLTQKDIGNTKRGPFEPNKKLPATFGRVLPTTYSGSGFDRGHMCNSKDRSDTVVHNDATFLRTNMVPQAPVNNQKTWEHLEEYCRGLAKQGNDLHIVAGPFGKGGTGKNGFKTKIGSGDLMVTVPSHTWKVILILEEAGAMPTKRSRTIAVMMPNDQNIDIDWTKYRVSIERVEEATGFKFFPDIPTEVANAIKSEADTEPIDPPPAVPKKKDNQ